MARPGKSWERAREDILSLTAQTILRSGGTVDEEEEEEDGEEEEDVVEEETDEAVPADNSRDILIPASRSRRSRSTTLDGPSRPVASTRPSTSNRATKRASQRTRSRTEQSVELMTQNLQAELAASSSSRRSRLATISKGPGSPSPTVTTNRSSSGRILLVDKLAADSKQLLRGLGLPTLRLPRVIVSKGFTETLPLKKTGLTLDSVLPKLPHDRFKIRFATCAIVGMSYSHTEDVGRLLAFSELFHGCRKLWHIAK